MSYQPIASYFPIGGNEIPNYSTTPPLQAIVQRLYHQLDRNRNSGEYHVASWALTILAHLFSYNTHSPHHWILTARTDLEGTSTTTVGKHCFVVEKYFPQHGSGLFHLFAHTRASTRYTFRNTIELAASATRSILRTNPYQFDVFLIVQKGSKIVFLEYHDDRNRMREVGQELSGCIPITQQLGNLPPVELGDIHGVERMYSFTTPCVYDVTQHYREVDRMLHHIKESNPRLLANA